MIDLCSHGTRIPRGYRGYCDSVVCPCDLDLMSPRSRGRRQTAGTVMSNVTRPSLGNLQCQCSDDEEVSGRRALTI
jgi:hypothetical protein